MWQNVLSKCKKAICQNTYELLHNCLISIQNFDFLVKDYRSNSKGNEFYKRLNWVQLWLAHSDRNYLKTTSLSSSYFKKKKIPVCFTVSVVLIMFNVIIYDTETPTWNVENIIQQHFFILCLYLTAASSQLVVQLLYHWCLHLWIVLPSSYLYHFTVLKLYCMEYETTRRHCSQYLHRLTFLIKIEWKCTSCQPYLGFSHKIYNGTVVYFSFWLIFSLTSGCMSYDVSLLYLSSDCSRTFFFYVFPLLITIIVITWMAHHIWREDITHW